MLPPATALLLAALVASSMAAPQAPGKPGDLKVAIGLIAKIERDHRVFEARLHRLEQIYTAQQATDKVARVKAVRVKHMQSYVKAMDAFGAKFGEDGFGKFRGMMDIGRKRTPGGAEAVQRKINAKAGQKSTDAAGGTPNTGGQK